MKKVMILLMLALSSCADSGEPVHRIVITAHVYEVKYYYLGKLSGERKAAEGKHLIGVGFDLGNSTVVIEQPTIRR